MVELPTYVYECEDCDYRFEEKQSFDDDTLTECPKCRGKIRRIIFATPVHYKGSGFATTDARGITGRKRKPDIKIGLTSDLPPEEREKHLG